MLQYRYLLGKDPDRGQRAARITALILQDADKLTLEELQTIQTDNQTIAGMEYVPYLENLAFNDPVVSAARDKLLAWDGQMLMDSPEAALYAFFWKRLLIETFNDQLPEDLRPDGSHTTEDVMYYLLQEPDNDWWDQLATPDVKERWDAILKTAEKAYQDGVDELGANFEEWQWGDLHTIYFENATQKLQIGSFDGSVHTEQVRGEG